MHIEQAKVHLRPIERLLSYILEYHFLFQLFLKKITLAVRMSHFLRVTSKFTCQVRLNNSIGLNLKPHGA